MAEKRIKSKADDKLFLAAKDRVIEDIKKGLSFKDAAMNNGVQESLFHTWKRRYPDFAAEVIEARLEGKKRAVNLIENSLIKVALGYEVEEKKEVTKQLSNGSTETTTERITKFIKPDTAAIIFALCNLAPDLWSNKNRLDFGSAAQGGSIKIEFKNEQVKGELEKLAREAKKRVDADN